MLQFVIICSVFYYFSLNFWHNTIMFFDKKNLTRIVYFLLKSLTPWPISDISEPCNCGNNIMELFDILTNISFAASERECDYL